MSVNEKAHEMTNTVESPFQKYQHLVLGHYSTAAWLRMLVLAMWSGGAYKVGLSQLAEVDEAHFDVAMLMMSHYRKYGERDVAFMSLAEKIRERLAEEQAALERNDLFEEWCRHARVALRDRGMRAGLVDDQYDWFERQFDAGKTPEEACSVASDH